MNFFTGISTGCFTPKKHMHMHAYRTGHVGIRRSNVLIRCTWARTRRVGVISDGRYYGLSQY